jgi:mannan endo-1,4-beta-mannosidase
MRSLAAFTAVAAGVSTPAASSSAPGFVSTNGTDFVVDGSPFTFIGTNSYYIVYSDPFMLDNVMKKAALNNFSVLRTWAWLDIGYPNGTGSVDGSGSKNGVWFRAWDPEQKTVVTNQSNLVHLDAVVAAAKKWGIRLILTVSRAYCRLAPWLLYAHNPRHSIIFEAYQ